MPSFRSLSPPTRVRAPWCSTVRLSRRTRRTRLSRWYRLEPAGTGSAAPSGSPAGECHERLAAGEHPPTRVLRFRRAAHLVRCADRVSFPLDAPDLLDLHLDAVHELDLPHTELLGEGLPGMTLSISSRRFIVAETKSGRPGSGRPLGRCRRSFLVGWFGLERLSRIWPVSAVMVEACRVLPC